MNRFKITIFSLLIYLPSSLLSAAEISQETPPPSKAVVFDNFDDGRLINLFGGFEQGDEEYPGGCIPSFLEATDKTFGGVEKSLQLDYDVSLPKSFSYFLMKSGPTTEFPGTSVPMNLSEYRYLSFWIKSDQVNPRFAIELQQDTDDDDLFVLGKDKVGKVVVSPYLLSDASEKWRKVVIPLEDFRRVEDWEKILAIVIVFENRLRSKQGILYMDEVLFGTGDPIDGNLFPPLDLEKLQPKLAVDGRGVNKDRFVFEQGSDFLFQTTEMPGFVEAVIFEISSDNGETWKHLAVFYDHIHDGSYKFQWPSDSNLPEEFLFRVVAQDIYGKPTVLTKPARGKRV